MTRSSFPMMLMLALIAVMAVAVGCGGGQGAAITVENPWVRATVMADGNSAAYMTIRNTGREADALVGAMTPVSRMTELHEMSMEGDVMRMRPIAGQRIEIPAGGRVELKPGGLHIMLMGVNQTLAPGTTVELTLRFEKAGEVNVRAEVRAVEGMGSTPMEHGGY
jgi:copper(I)-binding protein